MVVGDETDGAQGLRPHLDDGGDIERLEHRVDADPVPVGHPVGEVDGATIGNDQIDFGVGNPAGLDHVLDTSRDLEAAGDRARPEVPGEEVRQLRVEPESCLVGDRSPPIIRATTPPTLQHTHQSPRTTRTKQAWCGVTVGSESDRER